MEAFIYGIASILTFEVAIFVILSFLLIGKLSSFFGSHLAKVILLSSIALLLFYSFMVISPATAYVLLSGYSTVTLLVTIAIGLHFLGVFNAIKSVKLRSNVQGVVNWLAPVVLAYWLFVESFQHLSPFLMSRMVFPVNLHVDQSFEFIPVLFALGLILVVGGVLTFSWFFHDKFKDMQFWKVLQALASVIILIFSLRLLIMMTFV